MSDKPTLVLIAGAWHITETWNKVTSILKAQQFKCVPVALPSTKGDSSVSFGDDVRAVQDSIKAETTQGHNVVIVVHSYGGAIGQSAVKGLARPKEDALSSTNKKSGYVIGLAMMACGFGQTGMNFIDALGGKPPPAWKIDPSGFAVIALPARELFYHDLPEEEGNYWVAKLTKQALKPLMEGGEDSYSGWLDVPVWYLTTTEDHTFPVPAQNMFMQIAKDAGADITVRDVASSHSPMLSKPQETADFISEAVAYFVGS